jgi:hypothetical protein
MRRAVAIRLPALALVLLAGLPAWSASAHKPRMAIFLSRATYAAHRHTAQMAGQGWAGVANLAGLPYDTLFVEEIGSQDLVRYRVLVFAQCSAVEDRLAPKLTAAVERYAGSRIVLAVEGAGDAGQAVRLRSTGTPKRATLGGGPVEIARAGTDFELTLAAFRGRAELEVEFE